MMNAICRDILDRALIVTAKLIKMAFIPNVVTVNILLSQFFKQGMPERTLWWGQKLSEISFGFDEVSHRIIERAYENIQNSAELFSGASEKRLFLDSLMYITYDYMYRNRQYIEPSHSVIKCMSNGVGAP